MAEAEEQRVHTREFSYDVTAFEKQMTLTRWWVMEKGSEQSEFNQQYKLLCETIIEAKKMIRQAVPLFPHVKEEYSKSRIYGDLGCTVYLRKKKCHPLLGVKARGVIYTLLKLPARRHDSGVVTVSTGSFACILSHYGNILNRKVTVVMPRTIADEHVQKCRAAGATVILHGLDVIQAHDYAVTYARDNGLFYLDGNDHPNMIIGQATLGIEILEEMPGVNVVILPTIFPDCGLTAGIAKAIKEENSEISTIEVFPKTYDKFAGDIRHQTKLYTEPDFFSTKYQWSKFLQKETLFNNYRLVDGRSISGATRTLEYKEGIEDFCTSLGLGWVNSSEEYEKTFIKGKSIVILSFGEMDSYTDYEINTESQSAVSGAGPSTSHPVVPHAGPSTSRE